MITFRSNIPLLSFFLLILSIMEWVQGLKYQIIIVDLSSCISIHFPSNVLMLCCEYINIQNAMTFWWTDIVIALLTPFAETLCVFMCSHSSFFRLVLARCYSFFFPFFFVFNTLKLFGHCHPACLVLVTNLLLSLSLSL